MSTSNVRKPIKLHQRFNKKHNERLSSVKANLEDLRRVVQMTGLLKVKCDDLESNFQVSHTLLEKRDIRQREKASEQAAGRDDGTLEIMDLKAQISKLNEQLCVKNTETQALRSQNQVLFKLNGLINNLTEKIMEDLKRYEEGEDQSKANFNAQDWINDSLLISPAGADPTVFRSCSKPDRRRDETSSSELVTCGGRIRRWFQKKNLKKPFKRLGKKNNVHPEGSSKNKTPKKKCCFGKKIKKIFTTKSRKVSNVSEESWCPQSAKESEELYTTSVQPFNGEEEDAHQQTVTCLVQPFSEEVNTRLQSKISLDKPSEGGKENLSSAFVTKLAKGNVILPCISLNDWKRQDEWESANMYRRADITAKLQKVYDATPHRHGDFREYYRVIEVLSEGRSGTVYRGMRKADSKQVVIKFVPDYNYPQAVTVVGKDGKYRSVNEEVLLMAMAAGVESEVENPAVVKVIEYFEGSFDRENHVVIMMDMEEQSQDLCKFVHKSNTGISEAHSKAIIKQLVDGAEKMHRNGVFHGDLKLSNILIQLISDVPQIKIIDFGLSSAVTQEHTHVFTVNERCAPPEYLKCHPMKAESATVWQIGSLMSCMYIGDHINSQNYVDRYIGNMLSEEGKDFLFSCLKEYPSDRPTFEQLKQHPWLQ